MAGAGVRGLATRQWTMVSDLDHHSKAPAPTHEEELLRRWDEVDQSRSTRCGLRSRRSASRRSTKPSGEWEGPVYGLFLYWIDNEIHHRGQGYVYLRSLGIEPPAFYDRS